jgi:diadenosine tetraphosphate (Ap4A) HIT family hydrolase
MVYTKEQSEEVIRQILEQTKHLSAEQRAAIEDQLQKMTPEELEAFVQEQMGAQKSRPENQKGIFRMIVDGDVPSKKICENSDAIGVVSVRAVSKGHVLIIPKKPVGDANSMPAGAYNLARQVGKKVTSKLKAKSTAIQTENAFGEVVINVIPIYDKPLSMTSPRYEVKEGELEEVYKLLRVVKKEKKEKIKIEKKEAPQETILKLKRRVP